MEVKKPHLRVGVDLVEERARRAVPEAHLAARRPPPRSEEVGLPRAPSQGLDCGAVVKDLMAGGSLGGIPDVEDVVVATRSELHPVGAPLEAANLLRVGTLEARGDVLRDAHVVVDDGGVTRTGRQSVRVPRQSPDPGAVALHRADLAHAADVPDLNLGVVGADGNVVAVLHPRDRSDVVRLLLCGAQFLDVAWEGGETRSDA